MTILVNVIAVLLCAIVGAGRSRDESSAPFSAHLGISLVQSRTKMIEAKTSEDLTVPGYLPKRSGDSKKHKHRHRKNVLFIVVDDLRTNIGAYNFSMAHTPNLDQLAKEGLTFKRSYVQFPYCAPSRNSFMTGRRPDATRAWNFINDFREPGVGDDWSSLPEYFKRHDYLTLGSGKLFHNGLPKNSDYPRSWSPEHSYFTEQQSADNLLHFRGCVVQEPPNVKKPTFCARNVSADEPQTKYQLPDMKTRHSCIQQLRAAKRDGRHFFIGCGFIKPHVPWEIPYEFLAKVPQVDDIPLAVHANATVGMPEIAWHIPADILSMNTHDPNKMCNDMRREKEYKQRARVYRRAYYAAVAYVDHNIGKVLDELDDLGMKQQTAVIVFGDHGWHLGEHNLWGKFSNFELDLRIPTIIRAPWMEKSAGQVTDVLAEAVDFYPTLAELAGLPDPRIGEDHISGTSLAPVFSNPSNTSIKTAAFSQLAKLSSRRPFAYWPIPERETIGVMGYSVRVDKWRYTAWFEFDGVTQRPMMSAIIGRELYSHEADDGDFDFNGDNWNLADELPDKAAELHNMLVQHIDDHIVLPELPSPKAVDFGSS